MDAYFSDLNEGTQVIADDVKIHGPDEATHGQILDSGTEPMQKGWIETECGKVYFQSRF